MVQAKLVPITREYLHLFYSKYPMEPAVPEVEMLTHELQSMYQRIAIPGSKVHHTVGLSELPTRIDDNFWKNRMFCEEAAETLKRIIPSLADKGDIAMCFECERKLSATERYIYKVQQDNTAKVAHHVKKFLPNDFRTTLIESRAKANEEKYKLQIEKLIKEGAPVRQKYETYLKHQWERREQLSALGDASGLYRIALYLAGVPEVLLDFAKQVNAKLGPLEEQRLKYGPDLYKITALGNALNILVAAWFENLANLSDQNSTIVSLLSKCVPVYREETERIIGFVGDIFHKSPFFITTDELQSAEHGKLQEHMEEDADAKSRPQSAVDAPKPTLWGRLGFKTLATK